MKIVVEVGLVLIPQQLVIGFTITVALTIPNLIMEMITMIWRQKTSNAPESLIRKNQGISI